MNDYVNIFMPLEIEFRIPKNWGLIVFDLYIYLFDRLSVEKL